ncbi:MAG: response regulator [Syntrophales bacterium]
MKRQPVNILLVEDNEDHAELTLRALSSDKNLLNEVHVVKDGQEALDFVHHRGKYNDITKFPLPELILLDISLPKINGLEVLEILKKDPKLKIIPVIMLTTSTRKEEITKSCACGADSYVTKPINFEDFVRKIQEIRLYLLDTNLLPKEPE